MSTADPSADPSPTTGERRPVATHAVIATMQRDLEIARASIARVDGALADLAARAGAGAAVRDRPRPARYYRVLLGVYEQGRQGLDREAFNRLGAANEYDPRGLGGFFVGARGALRRDTDRVFLTEEGQRLLDGWLETLV